MKLFNITIFLLLGLSTQAQGIKGRITDEKQQSVPFATIYIESIQTGTTSNVDGGFEIKTTPGKFTILFRALGYKSIYKEVEITDKMVELKIMMPTETYQLKEVVISSKSEDPAYYIMRKAIALAPFHLREVSRYESKVYLKGTLYVDKMPKLLSRFSRVKTEDGEFQLKTGDVYVEESMYDITFNAPRFYKRVVRSTRSSIPGDSKNPVNPVIIIEASFYEPQIMDLISPLSPQAFQHYKFKYEGFTQDGENLIDKIRVIPRRESQDLFSGMLYIVEGKWCLYSLELSIKQFWGTMVVKEMFGRVEKAAWLPVSYNFDVNAKYMGMRGRFKYSSSVKYTKVQLNEKLSAILHNKPVQPDNAAKTDNINTNSKKIKQKLDKGSLSNTDMRQVSKKITTVSADLQKDTLKEEQIKELTKLEIDTLAVKRDTLYWNNFRPTPLTVEEIKSFEEGPQSVIQKVRRDSVQMAKDSTKLPKKRKSWWIIVGKQFKFSEGKFNVNYRGLLQLGELNFNTVDGFRYGLKSNLWWKLDSGRKIDIQPWIGYTFNRKALMWEVKSELYTPKSQEYAAITMRVGQKSADFNGVNGIHPFINTVSSLFFRENYMKIYQNSYLDVVSDFNLTKNCNLKTTLQYAQIEELENHSDYSFFFRSKKEYTPNIPFNTLYTPTSSGETYRNLIFSASLRVSHQRKIKSDGYNRKQNLYPTFTLKYTTGIPDIFSSESNFHILELFANKRFWLGRNRVLKYRLGGEYWLSSKSVYFSSFTPISVNELPVTFKNFDYTYQLLPYYTYNTNKWYIGMHVHYQTKLLVFKRLPIISNRIWTENLYINFLHTPVIRNYWEFGYGLGQLWAIGELGVFTSFEKFQYKSVGVKLSVEFE